MFPSICASIVIVHSTSSMASKAVMHLDPRFEYSPAQLWTAVEQGLQWPWFYVKVEA